MGQRLRLVLRSAAALGGLLAGVCLAAADWPVFDFTRAEEGARWTANRHIAATAVTPEGWELTLAGPDPYLIGPAADYPAGQPMWLRLVLRSDTGGSCQLFYFRRSAREADSVRFAVPAGEWVTGRVAVPALGGGYHLRIDPPGSSGRVVLKSLRAEPRTPLPEFDFRTVPDATAWEPTHDIASLGRTPEGLAIQIAGPDPYTYGPPRDYPAGEKLWLHLRLKSDSAGTAQLFYFPDRPTEENSVRFFVPGGRWHEAVAPLPPLGPGWRLRFDPPGQDGVCLLERLWFESRTAFPPPAWPAPEVPAIGAHPFELRAGALTLRHARDAWGAFEVWVAGRRMAVGLPNPLLGFVDAGRPVWGPFGNAPGAAVSASLEDGVLRLAATVPDAGGASWRLEQTFVADGNNAVAIQVQATPDRDRDLLYLPLFTVLPGVGTFGTNKTQALFAGLEYLANEPSSSEADIRGEGARRLVPDTAKITLPLMALAADGRWLGLDWEPAPEIAAVFDSPDRQFRSGGHLLGLIAPGSDGFNRDEGSLVPYGGLHLVSGRSIVLRATLTGGPGTTVAPALQSYVARRGLPPRPTPLPAAAEYFELAARGWLDSKIREGNLYHHAWWPGFGIIPAADAATWMSWLAENVADGALKTRLEATVREALAAVSDPAAYNDQQIGHVRYPVPALRFNQAAAAADRAAANARALLRRFEPDGRLLYRPPPGGTDYGATHFAPDANGHTANVVKALLENAAFAGDAGLIQDALARLRDMAVFRDTVPRGAQTWEIPLHTPDILAAAHLVRCYTLGYELTGDRALLDQAAYWAWTGLPFVYLRAPVAGDIGSYATIPVYGATAWVGAWFGRPVQWCGMVYADALNRLAVHDPAGPWRTVADGISASGVQQTWPASDPDRLGLLPDFVRLREQARDGPAINPATVLAGAWRMYGAPPPYTFLSFPRHGLRLHTPGRVSEVEETADGLSFRLIPWSPEPTSTLVNGFQQTPVIRLDGQGTPLAAPHEYAPVSGRLVLRLAGPTRVEMVYPERPRLGIRPGTRKGEVQLFWPRARAGWILEETSALPAADWRTTSFTPHFYGGETRSTLEAAGLFRFFRLRTRP